VYLKSIHKFIFLFIAILFMVFLQHNINAFAAKEKKQEEQKGLKFTEKMATILFQAADDTFVYKREGRSDPFVPFIKEKVARATKPFEELTGLQKFEPGQLTVVAIVISSTDRFAMVQDSNNQGYIIRKGILLGRTGVVEAIVPNKVIVKNYSYNLAGDKIYKTVEMVLKQEGEK
jgi:type IV pilus assembly protein PilP